jgi:hypothetical protein
MLKTSLASLAMATALLAPALSAPAEAGSLRKAVKIGATVVVTGLVIRCGVRTVNGKSCL